MKDREHHINRNKIFRQSNIPPDHPMCKCRIITKPEDVYFTYCTLYFIWEYSEECKESVIWMN